MMHSVCCGLLGVAVVFGMASGVARGEPRGEPLAADQLPSIKELPDPFKFNDGSRVKTKGDWDRRRAELKELVQAYEYGHLPPVPNNVKAEEFASAENAEWNARVQQYMLTMGPGDKVLTHLDLTIPKGKGPFPVIITGDLSWGKIKDPIVKNLVGRGYILAEFARVEVAPDSRARDSGIYPAYPESDSSALAAWAWGYHRVIDYLVTREDVDRNHIAITGHSRGGKATLLAGAMDERIALTAPNNSGCGGAGCYRLQAEKSEDIKAILKNFPFWFQRDFAQFIGKEDRLPIDQHEVKALVAPRAYLSTEALGDLWANPEGTQKSHLAAREVFEWLGAGDRMAIFYREGKHEQNEADWGVLLDFADQVFFGKSVGTKFNNYAFPTEPRPYSWKRPEGN